MKKSSFTKKVLALFMTLTLVVSLAPPAWQTAYGAVYGSTADTVCLNVESISNPKTGSAVTSGGQQMIQTTALPWAGDYIYFGSYEGTPMRWRVLDTDGTRGNSSVNGKMLLHSDKILESMVFSVKKADESWGNSAVRQWLTENYTSWFTAPEQNAICNSSLEAATSPFTWAYSVGVNGDKLFALDITDVCNKEYGYYLTGHASQWWKKSTGNLALNQLKTGKVASWWLRSGCNPVFSDGKLLSDSDPAAALATDEGNATWTYADYNTYGVAPALNVDKDAILMSTMVGTSKASAFDTISSTKTGGRSWYLTLKDGGNLTSTLDIKTAVTAGSTLTANITSISAGSAREYTQISALLTKGKKVYAYGKISDSLSAGSVEIPLPSSLSEGNYTLKIFAENVNERGTSYASEGNTYSLTVSGKAATLQEDENKTDDESKPDEEKPAVSKNAKVIAGVRATTLKAKAVAGKGYIKITWTKSKGYKVDKYQIYKSTKKTSRYKKSFVTTKASYKNTAGLKKGVRYYYKVRGIRVIDGKNYYTKWSNIVTRKAIK